MTKGDGKPCKKCRSNEWYEDGRCASCRRESQRLWRQKNVMSVRAQKKEWRQQNPEKEASRIEAWRAKNPEKVRGYSREWAKNNPEKTKEINSNWQKKNPEKNRANSLRWAKRHPEKKSEYAKQWRAQNIEKLQDRQREWKQQNRERCVANEQRRRARKTEAGGGFTVSEWESLVRHFGGGCLCCGRTDVKLTADHVVPISKGGSSNINNIQPLCQGCNSRKNNKIIDYRPRSGLGRWIQRKLFGD